MLITLRALRYRVKKFGRDNYRYSGRTRSDDGLRSYAIVDDLYNQEVLHIEDDDDVVEPLCGERLVDRGLYD